MNYYYDMGYQAYEEGWSIFDNPGSTEIERKDWYEGYTDARMDYEA